MISKFEMWRVVCTSVHDQVVNESLSNLEHFEKKKDLYCWNYGIVKQNDFTNLYL